MDGSDTPDEGAKLITSTARESQEAVKTMATRDVYEGLRTITATTTTAISRDSHVSEGGFVALTR